MDSKATAVAEELAHKVGPVTDEQVSKSIGIPDLYRLKLLRIQEVHALTTLSKSCINLWVAQNKFPKPITLSPTVKVWRASSIADWIDLQERQGINPDDTG